MGYENVNLERGHELHHRVTKCLHTEELKRDIPAGANFSQMITSDQTQQEDISQTMEGLVTDLRSASDWKRGLFSGSEGVLSDGEKSADASAVVRDIPMREDSPRAQSVRAENAASIACFGLEDSLDMHPERKKDDPIRVEGSRNLQFGSSFLRQKKEEIKTHLKGNAERFLKILRVLFSREAKEKETRKESPEELKQQQEYLLDSYGRDGAYKQMSQSGLLNSSISKKA